MAIGYGTLSAIVPVFNSEVYLAAAQISGMSAELSTALGLAIGHTVGKTATVVALRRGSNLPWIRKLRARATDRDVDTSTRFGRLRARIRHRGDQLLARLGDHRFGVPVVFISACIGIPPLFVVTLTVPATTMRIGWFATAVLAGRTLFFLAIAFGISALVHR